MNLLVGFFPALTLVNRILCNHPECSQSPTSYHRFDTNSQRLTQTSGQEVNIEILEFAIDKFVENFIIHPDYKRNDYIPTCLRCCK